MMTVPAFDWMLKQTAACCTTVADDPEVGELAYSLALLRRYDGRLFVLGVGGSAANASHAVNDFRKLCGIEAYAPTDNVAEITARTNDDGWRSVFVEWLKGSRLSARDAILILSVGGGNAEKNISANLVDAIDYAKSVGATILGIVGRDGGYTKAKGDYVVVVPVSDPDFVTPITESMQSVILHALVSHPMLAVQKAKWEATVP